MALVERFKEISTKVVNKELEVKDALEQIKSIDFNLFSIDDMELVQQAQWLPDQEAVDIMKGWMKEENTMVTCCSDGTRPVIFKIERIDY